MSTAQPDPFSDIRRAVCRRFGESARIENIVMPTLGGSNRTVVFDLVTGAASRRLASRQETYAGEEALFVGTAEQFRVLQIAHRHGFPAPEPIFEYDADDRMGSGFVTAFVGGEVIPKAIQQSPALQAIRPRLAARCGELLAHLHSLDVAEFAFLQQRPDSTDAIGAFLSRYDHYGERHPAIEFGFRWLERNRPGGAARAFLHGDFRCGNFIVAPDDIKAVLDWECTHLGAPMEDLGWLCMRSWRFGRPDLPVGGFGERDALYGAYVAAGGAQVDRDEIRCWEIFGLVRWAIYNIWQAHGHVTGKRQSVAYATCGRNTCLVEYDLLMTLKGRYQ